jgi:23S rRNA (adenine2503-C2)-methyltransferase
MGTIMSWNSIRRFDDQREHVAKFVFTKGDAIAEAVLYRYPTYTERTVLCCSVQSGCPVGCVFCGTGKRFIRSLTAQEIQSQVDFVLGTEINVPVEEIGRLQIMFMSMGEPLLNPHIYAAMRDLHAAYPKAELLVSTIAPRVPFTRFFETSAEIDKIGLQFSVHASTNAERDKLIPFREKLTLEEISGTGLAWHLHTGRHPFFNYIATVDTTEADAKRLAVLFSPGVWRATVSVLCTTDKQSRREDAGRATWFANLLVAYGFSSRVFDPAGQDTIGGGCGQLWYVQDWMRRTWAKPAAI